MIDKLLLKDQWIAKAKLEDVPDPGFSAVREIVGEDATSVAETSNCRFIGTLILTAIALVAVLLLAARASKVDPMQALRAE